MLDYEALTTLSAVSRSNARRAPDKICNIFEGRTTTFAEFDRRVDRVAAALIAAGATRVAYLGKNCDHVFEVFVGTSRAGGLFAPINWRLALPEIAQILARFEPHILFVGPEFADAVAKARDTLPAGLTLIAMDEGATGWPLYETWRDAHDGPFAAPEAGPHDATLILFTSGTTGLPKGVMLSHHNLLAQRLHTPEDLVYDHWDEDDISLMAMPLAHIGGIGWWLIGFENACPNVIAREFDPNAVVDFIERDNVSKLFIVPAALQFILRHPRAKMADFSRVKAIFYGAAPMPLALLREAMEVIGCGFMQCYGMTETTGTVTILMPDDHVPEGAPKMRSAGRAAPGCEVRIVEPGGRVLAEGEIGEVAIRGTPVMLGYYNDPEATERVLDADGWMLSGDAGYMDEAGYLYIHDRIKDMIISGGENVYPAEVENAIFGHPDINEVAVIGVPDEKWGEAVKAIVVPRENHTVTAEDVIAWTRERLAAFKCPKSVDVIPEMPRNASGKILRRSLRERYWAGRERQVS